MPRQRHQEPTLEQTAKGVWFIRPRIDVIKDGRIERVRTTITLGGGMGKREATNRMREEMQKVNKADAVVTSQVRFSSLLERYKLLHIPKQASSTRGKYGSHIKNHIEPFFGGLMLCEVDTEVIQKFLDSLKIKGTDKPLSWAAKTDIRNILSSLYTQAKIWHLWEGENPVENAHAGRKKAVYEQRKLTDEQTRILLATLPYDLRIGCCVCLFCTLRVSEMLGLQEKHIDLDQGLIRVRQRYCRGDLDTVKSEAANRDVPVGYLVDDLRRLMKGDPERYVFEIQTLPEWGRKESTSRDDRDLHQHFLRPAAISLGFYWKGFGFHALRREAITAMQNDLGIGQAMKMAGHTTMGMSAKYTLRELEKQERAVRARQEKIMGKEATGIQ